MKSVLLFGFCALLLVACGAEPEVLRTLPPPPTPTPAELASLAARPATIVGAALFIEKLLRLPWRAGCGRWPIGAQRAGAATW